MSTRGSQSEGGFTFVEMMIVIAIIAILVSIGVPIYQRTIEAAELTNVTAELQFISREIDRYVVVNGEPPDSLADVGLDTMRDPWGNPYEYKRVDLAKNKGKSRKDKNLVPINSDYDLYSKGPDGKSVSALTAQPSQDDIVRAQDGGYFGLAADYTP